MILRIQVSLLVWIEKYSSDVNEREKISFTKVKDISHQARPVFFCLFCFWSLLLMIKLNIQLIWLRWPDCVELWTLAWFYSMIVFQKMEWAMQNFFVNIFIIWLENRNQASPNVGIKRLSECINQDSSKWVQLQSNSHHKRRHLLNGFHIQNFESLG